MSQRLAKKDLRHIRYCRYRWHRSHPDMVSIAHEDPVSTPEDLTGTGTEAMVPPGNSKDRDCTTSGKMLLVWTLASAQSTACHPASQCLVWPRSLTPSVPSTSTNDHHQYRIMTAPQEFRYSKNLPVPEIRGFISNMGISTGTMSFTSIF